MEFLQPILDALAQTTTFTVTDINCNTRNEYGSRYQVLQEYPWEEDGLTNINNTITIKSMINEAGILVSSSLFYYN